MLDELLDSMSLIIAQTQANYVALGFIALLPCFFYLLNVLTGNRLLLLGIHPRRLFGLVGIVFAPFLHANFNHLFFNIIPLVVLSNFVLIEGVGVFLKLCTMIILLSGFLIWCFGKRGVHVGASALITGLWGFLISNIVQQGTFTAILLGLISLYYFAGIFFGVFPSKKGVSWEGHLFGLVAGVAASYFIS